MFIIKTSTILFIQYLMTYLRTYVVCIFIHKCMQHAFLQVITAYVEVCCQINIFKFHYTNHMQYIENDIRGLYIGFHG